jgi:hypothetical protein
MPDVDRLRRLALPAGQGRIADRRAKLGDALIEARPLGRQLGNVRIDRRQPEDGRARRKRIARENEAVYDWLQRKNFEDEYRAHHVEPERRTEPTESFDWQWVDRRIEARLREERAYFEDALAAQARTTNEVMAGIVRALDNVARSAATKNDGETLAGAMRKLSETIADNQRALMRAIRRGRASQVNGVAQANDPAETARIH